MGRYSRCSSRKVGLTLNAIFNGPSALSCSPPFRQEAVFRRRASDDHRRPGSESNLTGWSKKVGPTAFSPRGTRQAWSQRGGGTRGWGLAVRGRPLATARPIQWECGFLRHGSPPLFLEFDDQHVVRQRWQRCSCRARAQCWVEHRLRHLVEAPFLAEFVRGPVGEDD